MQVVREGGSGVNNGESGLWRQRMAEQCAVSVDDGDDDVEWSRNEHV